MTGGAGCVGHYVVESLLSDPGNRLHVLLRDPSKLRADLRERVTVHVGDLARPSDFLHLMPQMDAAVLAAASWGGEEARQVNVLTTWSILDALDPDRCRRVIYFSTASLLGNDGQLLEAAAEHGTGYIRQKHEALVGIPDTRMADRVVTVFPTVILGGDDRHPFSHSARGLRQSLRYLWLLRFFTLDGRFHVIHAHDIARAVAHLLDAPLPQGPVVLGYQPLDAGEAIGQLAATQGLDAVPQIDLTPLAMLLPHIIGHKFTTWDRYCLQHRDFTYPVFDIAAALGPSGYETLAGIVRGFGPADHDPEVPPPAPDPHDQRDPRDPQDPPDPHKENPCGQLRC